MGTWRPTVHSFSSNWRELRTLVHTLERELGGIGRLTRSTLFYFTDNLVSYYIVSNGSSSSPELQKLLRRLKYLELVLDIRLEIVHIPGLHMIAQGTDGLSRGVRFPDGGLQRRPEAETCRIFAALPAMPEVIQWTRELVLLYRRHSDVTFMTSTQTWTFRDVVGRATLWFPAPEWAHQLIDAVLNVWVEQPWTTEAFFLVPRIFQRDWGRASKHVMECGTVAPAGIPIYGTHSDIPCVLLHLPCYVRCLPLTRWMEPAPRPKGAEWHREQAEFVRGMS
jgi:hypothetical protein